MAVTDVGSGLRRLDSCMVILGSFAIRTILKKNSTVNVISMTAVSLNVL